AVKQLDLITVLLEGGRLVIELLLLRLVDPEDHAAILLVPDPVIVKEALQDRAGPHRDLTHLARVSGAELFDLFVIGWLEERRDEPSIASGGTQGDVARLQHDHRLA